jgi:hypothetical protein
MNVVKVSIDLSNVNLRIIKLLRVCSTVDLDWKEREREKKPALSFVPLLVWLIYEFPYTLMNYIYYDQILKAIFVQNVTFTKPHVALTLMVKQDQTFQ